MVKNVVKLSTLLILAWLWFPSGDPSDFIITGAIIQQIGLTMYMVLSGVFILYLYKTIDGNTIKAKLSNVKKGIRKIIK